MVPLYKERVLAKAAKQLASKARKRPDARLEVFKRFCKMEEHRLRLWHNAGGGGREIGRQRSDLIDVIFRELFDIVMASVPGKPGAERVAVAAFGGYGRREMNPFSDIDIMFLLARGKPGSRLEEVIRQTLVALWDLGFKVGHSTRSITEAIKQANEDMLTKTSMLECRFLCGEREVFNGFKERFELDCVRGREAEYIEWRFRNQEENRLKYGRSVFMQEPNVKNGCGGLRDYQNLLWIAYFKKRIPSMPKLVEAKFLRTSERSSLDKAYDFLLRVRTEMHYQNGRPIDGLTLQLQGRVATAFRYPQKSMLRRCEAFMRDLYSRMREIHQITAAVIERMDARPVKPQPRLLSIFKPAGKEEKFDGFIARGGLIYPSAREIFNQDPFRLIRVFQHMQVRQLKLSAEIRDLIRRRLRLIDRTFQYARIGREIFLSILSRKGEVGPILREMHDLGVLGKYLPEFGALTCLVQHEFFHRYTADEHTLVCIEKLDGILLAEEQRFAGYRALFQKIEDPSVLYLALLLHDTGKAANVQHHESESTVLAHRVARRLQLSPRRRRMLLTLVDSHYTLSHTAQARNLEDPATISEFAAIINSQASLDALMLLTLADGMGTSDQGWSDWKEGLVWRLYRKANEYLEAGPGWVAYHGKNMAYLKETVAKLLGANFREEFEAHFHYMPERYFQAFGPAEIAEHLRLFREFFAQRLSDPKLVLAPAIRWIQRPEQGHTEVWFCGWDRARLLQRIAGAFVSVNLNILSADVFTRGDNLALDIFRVCDSRLQPATNSRDIERVVSRLLDSLKEEEYDFSPLIGRKSIMRSYRVSHEAMHDTRIMVDNRSHPVYSIVEIQTADRIGLLYSLLRAFSEAGISIALSRVTTEMEVALDTFYVTDRSGNKIESREAIERLERLLQRAAGETFE